MVITFWGSFSTTIWIAVLSGALSSYGFTCEIKSSSLVTEDVNVSIDFFHIHIWNNLIHTCYSFIYKWELSEAYNNKLLSTWSCCCVNTMCFTLIYVCILTGIWWSCKGSSPARTYEEKTAQMFDPLRSNHWLVLSLSSAIYPIPPRIPVKRVLSQVSALFPSESNIHDQISYGTFSNISLNFPFSLFSPWQT